MRSIAIAALLISTLAFGAQNLPDAATITKQVQDAAKQRASIEYVKELTGEVTLDGKVVREVIALGRRIPAQSEIGKQTIALQNPGKARIELQLAGGGNLLVSDGELTWTYRPSTKSYTKIAAAQTPEGVAANMAVLDVLGFFADSKTTKTAREESITIDGKIYDCWVLTSSVKLPAQAAMGGQLSEGVLTSWIDKKLLLEVKEEIAYSVKVPPAAGEAPVEYQSKIRQIVRDLKVDQRVATTLFAFAPPADAREQAPQSAGNRVDLTGKDAPSFRGVSLDGKAYSLEELKGRPVLLDFWASWCGPCIRSMPTLEKLHHDYRAQGLVVLGIDVGEKREVVEKFLTTKPVPYPVIMGDEAGIPAAYGVSAYPTFVMIAPDGKISSHLIGFNESTLPNIVATAGVKK
jgi:thiol-disulfide isomerase/thioredoxin/outer membrane lipoprotein-sorting protein